MTDPTARQAETMAADADNTTAPEAADSKADSKADFLAEAKREAAEFKDKLLRTLAEMENLRKRTEREVLDARHVRHRRLCTRRIGGCRQYASCTGGDRPELREAADAKVKALIEGVELTERELLKSLEKNGVKKFSPEGEKFDPNVHQAMYEVPTSDLPPGQVAQVIQAGYMIGDRVLRPAMVAVSKAAPKPAASANDNPHSTNASK